MLMSEAKRQYAAHYLDLMLERYRGFETKSAQILGFVVIAETILIIMSQTPTLDRSVVPWIILAGVLLFISALFSLMILWPMELAYPGPDLEEATLALKSADEKDLDSQLLDWYGEAAKAIDPILATKAKLFKVTCVSAFLGTASLICALIQIAAGIGMFKF